MDCLFNLTWIVLMMHISRERITFVCYQFFKELRNRFGENQFSQMVLDGIRRLVNG